MVWRGPRIGFVAERREDFCCYGDALSTIFLLACFCALLPTFRFLFFPFLFFSCNPVCLSSSCLFACAAICYSQQVRVLSACCVICTLRHLGILFVFYSLSIFFRSSYFSGGVFLLCSRTRYASTCFAYLDSLAFGFSLSHCSLWPTPTSGWAEVHQDR